MLVDKNQDTTHNRVHGTRRTPEYLTQDLKTLGVPVELKNNLGVDITWVSGGELCMWDLKTAEDLIKSVDDGRLRSQVATMQKRNTLMCGFVIEGVESEDGVTVGYGPYSWEWERYDHLKLSLQGEGMKFVYCPDRRRIAQRLFALYKYSAKDEHNSWIKPTAHKTLHHRYTDKTWLAQVEMLMSWPGLGEDKANNLLDRYTVMDIYGSSAEGVAIARKRWEAVPGIGTTLVKRWDDFLHEEFTVPTLRGK